MKGRRPAAPDVGDRLTALEAVLSDADGRLSAADVADARAVLSRAGERLRIAGRHTVVALAGATGSGKSSLFNAITGTQTARVGVTRPTTSTPHAAVWGADPAAALLERLGVPAGDITALPPRAVDGDGRADGHGLADGLVLVDLPDFDSTERGNRAQVDRLLDLVDLFVWVVDPQKYADGVLHEDYLRPLSSYAEVMVVVFNQIDRVTAAQAGQCLADLGGLLRADGLAGVPIVATSARTGAGLVELQTLLTGAVERHEAHVARITADVARVTARLADQVAGGDPATIGRGERAQLIAALEVAAGAPGLAAAAGASYRREAALRTGWPVTRWVGRLRRDPLRALGRGRAPAVAPTAAAGGAATVGQAQLANAVRAVVTGVSDSVPAAWQPSVRRAVGSDDRRLGMAVQEAVAPTAIPVVRPRSWWRVLGAVQLVLVLALLAGVVWLGVLAALQYFRLPDPPMYEWHRVPLPTWLVAGGALAGLLVALVGRLFARVGGRRRSRQVRALLHERLAAVARTTVIDPLVAELATLERVRAGLRRAAG